MCVFKTTWRSKSMLLSCFVKSGKTSCLKSNTLSPSYPLLTSLRCITSLVEMESQEVFISTLRIGDCCSRPWSQRNLRSCLSMCSCKIFSSILWITQNQSLEGILVYMKWKCATRHQLFSSLLKTNSVRISIILNAALI